MGLLGSRLPKKITPIIGGKKYPRENVISVTPSQERRIAGLLGHKGRIGVHGINHYPPGGTTGKSTSTSTSNGPTGLKSGGGGGISGGSSAGVGGVGSGSGSKSPSSSNTAGGNAKGGATTNTKMGNSTQTGGVKTTSSLGGSASKGGVSIGNVNTQPATQKMGGSTQSGMGLNAPAVANAVKTLSNSLPGSADKNLNYGYGTPGNPAPSLNNTNPLQGHGPGSPNAYDTAVSNLVNKVKPLSIGPVDQGSVMKHLNMGKPIAPPVKSYPNSMPGNINPGLNYGPGTAPAAPQAITDPYGGMGKMGLNSSQISPYNQPSAPQAVTDPWGGMGKFGLNSSQISPYNQPASPQAVTDPYGGMGKMGLMSGQTSPYNQPAQQVSSPLDPSMPGQFANTKLPGYGVPDIPNIQNKQFYDQLQQNPNMPGQITANGQPGYSTAWMNSVPVQKQFTESLTPGMANPPMFNPDYPTAGNPANASTNYHTTWDWTGLGQMDKTGQTVTPPTKPYNAPISAGFGPTFGPETPQGTGPGQQDEGMDESSVIDPTSAYSPQVQTVASKILNALPAVKTGKMLWDGVKWVAGKASGYSNDVSLGTENSGYRTDRAPSPGNAGTWNPKGGDSDLGMANGVRSNNNSAVRGGGRGFGGGSGNGGTGNGNGGGTPGPVTPAPANWYYPQYTQDWAGLPTGIGGPIWSPPKTTNEVDPLDPANWLNGLLGR